MSKPLEQSDLNIPADSELHGLLECFPDIEPVRFGDGEYLANTGEESDEIYLVLRGAYVVEQPSPVAGKRPTPLAVSLTEDAASPSFVCELSYLGTGYRTASVRSSGSTDVLRLKPCHLDEIIQGFPQLTRILCRQLAVRVKETTELVKEHARLFSMEGEQIVKQPGEVVFAKDEPAEYLYELVDGELARFTDEGEEPIGPRGDQRGFLEPGPYLRDGCYTSTVKATSRTILVAIAKNSKLAVIRNVPELAVDCLDTPGE